MATITAYDVANKEADVKLIDPVILKHTKNGNIRYQAKGKTKKGNYVYRFLSEKDALKYVKDGTAKKGW